MSVGSKRKRTDSEYEERNVSQFVSSCASFSTNVQFYGAQTPSAPAHVVALFGTEAQLTSQGPQPMLPFLTPAHTATLAAAVKTARSGSLLAVSIDERRVLVGVISSVASRHNCPTRPDVITSLTQAALDDPYVKGSLDIFVRSTEYLCVATAVARGSDKRFSAKSGLAEHGYVGSGTAIRVVFPEALPPRVTKSLSDAANAVQLCQRLVDAPTNLLDTVTFAEIVETYAAVLGFKAEIIRGEALREQGYGGLYGVGKAAEFPPALAVLTYRPEGGIEPMKKIAMVGKGIVYDTGGLAIKTPKTNMCTMKHDMGGAAAVFCAFLAAVSMKVDAEIACLLCLADNAIGPRAQRNDDIVRMKSGLTIEINNTDAEGRLVLGDGVFHASALLPFTPDVIVDMATLTGAQGIATGRYHAAIYSNSGEYEVRVCEAGRKCGDLAFPVVYCPEFHNREFASKVADYKNSVANTNNAQVSCAGQFIGNNLARDYKGAWVHVDLAAPATRDEGTGFGVALALQTFFADRFEP